MYNFLIGTDINNIPKIIDGKNVIISRSTDTQLNEYDSELVIRVKYDSDNIYLLTALFKLK